MIIYLKTNGMLKYSLLSGFPKEKIGELKSSSGWQVIARYIYDKDSSMFVTEQKYKERSETYWVRERKIENRKRIVSMVLEFLKDVLP